MLPARQARSIEVHAAVGIVSSHLHGTLVPSQFVGVGDFGT